MLYVLVLGIVVGIPLSGRCLFLGENAGDAGGNFMVNDRFIVLTNDIDTKFLVRA